MRELIEAGAWLIGSLVTAASTIGYLRARDRSTTERFESLEARVLLLESPSDAITRAEFEARQQEIFRNIGWLAEEILRSRRR